MSITIPASIIGAAMVGFTTPGYTTTPDVAPDINGKQVAVVGVTGTQAGVTLHTVSSPFTLTFFRPKVLRRLGIAAANGYIASVPNNGYKFIVRKGVIPLAGQPSRPMIITVSIDCPAGADTADAANVKAALSAAIGALSSMSSGIGDTVLSGVA